MSCCRVLLTPSHRMKLIFNLLLLLLVQFLLVLMPHKIHFNSTNPVSIMNQIAHLLNWITVS
jgi:hypothetical protein